MSRFYFILWLKWASRLALSSLFSASMFSLVITLIIYIMQGIPAIDSEVAAALFAIFKFWFPIVWSFTLLLSLFRGLKYVFNDCINGYQFKLLTCKGDEFIEQIGYGDLVKVWRKWFMLNIWLIGSFMILALVFTNVFTSLSGVFEWFNIYWLFIFLLLSGYISFIVLGVRCKSVKVLKC